MKWEQSDHLNHRPKSGEPESVRMEEGANEGFTDGSFRVLRVEVAIGTMAISVLVDMIRFVADALVDLGKYAVVVSILVLVTGSGTRGLRF